VARRRAKGLSAANLTSEITIKFTSSFNAFVESVNIMSIEVDNAAQRLLDLALKSHGNQSTNNRTFLYHAPNPFFDNDPPPPHNLCDICQSMRFRPPYKLPIEEAQKAWLCFPKLKDWEFNRRLFYFHQPSLEALYNSSEDGCHCCLLIHFLMSHSRRRPFLPTSLLF